MSPEEFLEKFDLLGDTPNAVKAMREMVLAVAFAGGLSGELRVSAGLPTGWTSKTIDAISDSITPGFACSKSNQVEGGHVHLRTHNISTLGTLNVDLLVRINPAMVDPKKASLREGDILFNNTNSQELVGKTALVDKNYDYAFSNHITRIRLAEDVLPAYVTYYLTYLRNSGHFSRLCTRWINQAAINTDRLREQRIPLPPLAEQKRIVAKVDELMVLCDRLEAQQQEREHAHASLTQAALARFADDPTLENLKYLFHGSFAVMPSDIRSVVHSLAVQGLLVPQVESEGHAEDALGDARVERANLLQEGLLRRQEKIESPDGTGHIVPPGWSLCALSEICVAVTDGDHLPPPKSESGVPFLVISNVRWGGISFESTRFVARSYYEGLDWIRKPKRNDVLYTLVGSFGIPVLVDTDREFCVQRHIGILRPARSMCPRYLAIVMASPFVLAQTTAIATGIAQKTVPLSGLRKVVVPVPPLAEQRRIVAKVDDLMALVDRLEADLSTARTSGEKLMDVVVSELTAET